MTRALSEFMVTGIKTTIPFELAILQDPDFRRGNYTTNFVERFLGGARRELIQDKA
jgi:acetyl-CoA carboxylase biotin carboxylase subunit